MWPNRRYLDLVGIDHPIIQAPMAGANLSAMVIAVSRAGGLGSLPCGMLNVDQARAELNVIRQQTDKPINVNFFSHEQPVPDDEREKRWRNRLAPYHAELGIETTAAAGAASRAPFDEGMCRLMVELRPRVVSFHYGLPERSLMEPLKAAGCVIQGTATTGEEARWLEARGADAIVAQGLEAGGHRGMFLARDIGSQVGTFALVPQIVDAVRLPVVAAGGIADARGIVAALALGASAVQIGTGYSFPRGEDFGALSGGFTIYARRWHGTDDVLSGTFARGIVNRSIRDRSDERGRAAVSTASGAIQRLRATAEAQGSGDFSPLGRPGWITPRELGARERRVAPPRGAVL